MSEILKKHSGPLILCVVFALIGATFGFLVDADEQGIYLSVNFPDGHNAFTIGRPELTVQNLDFASLDVSAAHQVALNIAKLDSQHPFSELLWNMAQNNEGPFRAEQVAITLVFSDQFAAPLAATCSNSPVYGKSFVAFGIHDPAELVVGNHGILEIAALLQNKFSPECNNSSASNMRVWIDRSLVENWLGKTLAGKSSLSVIAKFVISTSLPGVNTSLAGLQSELLDPAMRTSELHSDLW